MRGALKVLAYGCLGYGLLVALVWWFQRKIIYFPMGTPPAAAQVLPGAGDVGIATRDGLTLGAWFVPARGGAPKAAVLVCNGNAGNRSHRASLAEALARRGYAVLLFDYRGFGGNGGTPSEAGLLEDVRAARARLEELAGGAPLVLFGESLGSAVALAEAVERPPAALVLRSPFSSLTALGRLHYPFFPVGWLLRDRYPSLARVARLASPLFVAAGERDRIVPLSESRTLFEAAPVTEKRLLVLARADHNDFELLAGQRLLDELDRFLEEVLEATAVRSGDG
ncbi:MAG: alpha/beta fold hydrolase [Deferrisomatales bacterium]|nr:alpha/beta fold hydrolase [Deferrisomatales bacterium]